MSVQIQSRQESHNALICRCCGAVLPQQVLATRFDQVPRNEHAKRAIEVALTGGFSIALIGVGVGHSDALALAQIVRYHGSTAFCLMPCLCGFAGDPYHACTCTVSQIARMQAGKRYQKALLADIHIEVATPPEARLGTLSSAEPDERILERVAVAQQRPRPAITQREGAVDRLMAAAVRQLDLSSDTVTRLWQVASVIAQLAGRDLIGAAHLAESIQYRWRIGVRPEPVK